MNGSGLRDVAEIEQYLVPEPRIEQVEHGMLRAADIQIDRSPVLFLVRTDECLGVLRIDITEVVPA